MNDLLQRLLVSVFIIISLTACNKKAGDSNPNNDSSRYHFNDTLALQLENPKITEYRAFVQQLDSSDASSATKAVEQFKTTFINQSQGLCDTAFVIYQHLMDTIELNLNEKLHNDTTDYSVIFSGEPISKKIKNYLTLLQQNGFKFSSADGMIYIEQYRPFAFQHLSFLLSEPMKSYLNEISMESAEGFAMDQTIIISSQQLVDRILWYENFIKNNPAFVLLDNCKTYKKAYLSYLISGYGKTNLYSNVANKELSPYFAEAYDYLFKTYPESETATLALPYYNALKEKQAATVRELKKKLVIKGLIYNLE